jgi:methylphosphotriester-DNA--protein-cysteine methyltransferase
MERPYNPPLPGMVELAPGVWRLQDSDRRPLFVGSAQSRRFHTAACGHGARIRAKNRLGFASEEAAASYGYRPCLLCKPGESE